MAARIQATSAPAQKEGPSPAMTTARRSPGPSRASAANTWRTSALNDALKALWTSGRVRVTRPLASPCPSRPSRIKSFRTPARPLRGRVARPTLARWAALAPRRARRLPAERGPVVLSRPCRPTRSHPEHAELRVGDGRIEGGIDAQGKDPPRVQRIDDAVGPQAGRREIRRTFPLVRLERGLLEPVPLLLIRG